MKDLAYDDEAGILSNATLKRTWDLSGNKGFCRVFAIDQKALWPWGRPLISQGLSALYNLMCWMRSPQYFCNTGVDL